jgi:hypothetical protein
MNHTSKRYRQINIWSRLGDGRIAVYRCFEVLPEGKYCVQSKDFFSDPIDVEALRRSELQILELLTEEVPEIRTEAYDSLEEAIQKHEEEFAWSYALEKQQAEPAK